MTEKKQARSMHFCQKPASCLLTYRGVTRGAQSSGCRITTGATNHCGGMPDNRVGPRKVPTISQILSSVEYICFRKTSGSNVVAPNLLLDLDPI